MQGSVAPPPTEDKRFFGGSFVCVFSPGKQNDKETRDERGR